jgi:hypothetical protein
LIQDGFIGEKIRGSGSLSCPANETVASSLSDAFEDGNVNFALNE